MQDRELEGAILDALEEIKGSPIVVDGGIELTGVVERDGHAHVALGRDTKLARGGGEIERRGVRLHGLGGAVEAAIHGAERDEDARAKARVVDLVTLHRVAGLLEGLRRCEVLAQLAVGDAPQVLEPRHLGRVVRGVDQRERFVDAVERGLSRRHGQLRLREQAQEGRAVAFAGNALEAGCDLGAHDVPVVALGRGLRGQAMEREALFGRERRIAEEVIEALGESGGDDLEGAHRGPDKTGLDLRDEPLGELLAGELRLAHTALAAGASYALPEARCRRRFDAAHGAPL